MVNLASYKTEIENAKESYYAQVPDGDYVIVCISTEEKENSKRNGRYIQNEYEIQEGEFAGEKLIDRINFDNPNEKARQIAFATIKALGQAVGIEPLTDTEQLIGKRIVAKIKNIAGDPIFDDYGVQKKDESGNLLFYRNINITKYSVYSSAPKPTTTSGSFPFPK